MSIEFNHNEENVFRACGFKNEEEYTKCLNKSINISSELLEEKPTEGFKVSEVLSQLSEKERVAFVLNGVIGLQILSAEKLEEESLKLNVIFWDIDTDCISKVVENIIKEDDKIILVYDILL